VKVKGEQAAVELAEVIGAVMAAEEERARSRPSSPGGTRKSI